MANTYQYIDPTGSSSNGSGSETTLYEQTFSLGDWSVSGSDFSFSISATAHGQGEDPLVQVEELVGSFYVAVDVYYEKNGSGDIIIKVGNDSRFSGRVLIKG